jgi:hypothetical protein
LVCSNSSVCDTCHTPVVVSSTVNHSCPPHRKKRHHTRDKSSFTTRVHAPDTDREDRGVLGVMALLGWVAGGRGGSCVSIGDGADDDPSVGDGVLGGVTGNCTGTVGEV